MRRRGLRLKLRDELWRFHPKAQAAAVWDATDRVLRAVGCDPRLELEADPVPGCACWGCLLRLHAVAAEHRATMQVDRESEEEHD